MIIPVCETFISDARKLEYSCKKPENKSQLNQNLISCFICTQNIMLKCFLKFFKSLNNNIITLLHLKKK